MRILGIDPGTALLGYGVIESGDQPSLIDCGVIATEASWPMPERLRLIHEGVSSLIRTYSPSAIAVEQLFFARNVTTAIAVGQARGVVLLAAAQAVLPVHEYSPSEVKHATVGYGKAEKSQIQEMVRIILGLETSPKPDDVADALAIAICHSQRMAFDALTTVER